MVFVAQSFSHSVMSDSLWSHGLQHARLPCPSPSPGVCSNSCPFSQWCCATISSSVIPFSFLQSFPTSGSFLMSWLFASGGQSIGASALASIFLMSIQGWLTLGFWSPGSPRESRVFPNITVQKYQFLSAQPSLWPNSHTVYLVVLFLIILRILHTVSIVVTPIYIPNNSVQGFLFLHNLANKVICCLFYTGHSDGY